MGKQKTRRVEPTPLNTYNLETMAAEIDECVELLRPHYPDADEEALRNHARCLRSERYERGHWPSAKEIAAAKAVEDAAAALAKAREAAELAAAEASEAATEVI
jgi:hypothetical protein